MDDLEAVIESLMPKLEARLRPKFEEWYREMWTRPRYVGDPARVHCPPSSSLNNALLNLNSGHIYVGEDSFVGFDVIISTCTHNVDTKGEARKDWPREGYDITIGNGVWIASGAMILGPCRIGDHAVIGAGSVVRGDIPPGTLYVGPLATKARDLRFAEEASAPDRKDIASIRDLLDSPGF